MPNHIKNRIELIGSIQEIDAILKRFGTEVPASLNRTHDEKLLICKSKTGKNSFCWLDLSTGECHEGETLKQIGLPDEYEPEINQGYFCFPDFKKVIPPPNDPAYNDLPSQKVAEKSPNWWYSWNVENWGTKWESYSCVQLAINVFMFETAWSPVPKIITVISKSFPKLVINYTWADEDSGHNCGTAVYKNGLVEKNIPKDGSKEAYDIYFELNPESKADYHLINGNYEYVEQD